MQISWTLLSSLVYHFELRNIQISWDVASESKDGDATKEDLVLSIKLIEFGTRTGRSARLTIGNLQLQTVPPGQDKNLRSLHSALLPQVIFNVAYVSTAEARRMAFQATGGSLDLRLTSGFIVPAASLAKSISLTMKNVRRASAQWTRGTAPVKKADERAAEQRQRSLLGNKRLEGLLIDADFAGAVVYVSSKRSDGDGLHASKFVDASSNILYPSVVPLLLDIMSSVKEVVSDGGEDGGRPRVGQPKAKTERSGEEDKMLTADPSAVLGRLKLNIGLRICRQDLSLSCQPMARVAATACFDDFYLTMNTVTSQEQGSFFAVSGALTRPHASVQHVYSRESTASFEVDAVTLSLMNSKHVSGTSSVSAMLSVSPMKVSVNAKTAQGHLVQRYQQVAATAAFPWMATISVAALDVDVDLGQAIGKSVLHISGFWVSSKKTSDWEQNLCLGFNKISIDCTGRLSGFTVLQDLRLRTCIHWPRRQEALNETPLVQASLALHAWRVKAAFDYQAFLVADVTSLAFLMYNVREAAAETG